MARNATNGISHASPNIRSDCARSPPYEQNCLQRHIRHGSLLDGEVPNYDEFLAERAAIDPPPGDGVPDNQIKEWFEVTAIWDMIADLKPCLSRDEGLRCRVAGGGAGSALGGSSEPR